MKDTEENQIIQKEVQLVRNPIIQEGVQLVRNQIIQKGVQFMSPVFSSMYELRSHCPVPIKSSGSRVPTDRLTHA